MPSFLEKADELRKRGVDTIACVSVNDAYVMKAWAEKLNALGKIQFLGDPSAQFAKQIGLDIDLSAAGLGLRSKRFSMIVDNGKVATVNVENSPVDFSVTGADRIIEQLDKLPKKQ